MKVLSISAATPAPLRSIERTVRDTVERGVTYEVPRRFPLFGPKLRPAEPQEVTDRLARGRNDVQVRLAEGLARLPLRGLEDLDEVAVFTGIAPPETLPKAELARSLSELENIGWHFHAGEEIGTYGAYNALTDDFGMSEVTATRDGQKLYCRTEQRVGELAAFYRDDPLGRLEAKGYQFFNLHGERRPAYGERPPESLGKNGKVWMSAARHADVDRFERLLALHGTPSKALQALELEEDKAALGALSPILRAVVSAVPGQAGRHTLMERLAVEPTTFADLAGLSVEGLVKEDALAARHAILAQGASFPETRDAATVQSRWQLADPERAIQGLVRASGQDPGQLALASTGDKDVAAHERQLDEVPSGELAKKLRAVAGSLSASVSLWKAAMLQPEVTTVDQLLTFIDAFQKDAARSQVTFDLPKICAVLLEDLRSRPELHEASQLQSGWGVQDPLKAVEALLRRAPLQTPEEIGAFALASTADTDTEAQERQLEGNALARELYGAVQSRRLKLNIWKAAMAVPTVSSGEELQSLLTRIDKLHQGTESDLKDYRLLQKRLYPRLETFADTRAGFELQQQWQLADPCQAFRGLLAHPEVATDGDRRELALASTGRDDVQAMKLQLASMTDPALSALVGDLLDRCHHAEFRSRLWSCALSHPEVLATSDDVVAFVGKIDLELARLVRTEQLDEDVHTTRELAWEKLKTCPDSARAAKQVDSWQPVDRALAFSALLKHCKATSQEELRALALACTSRQDETLQNHLLGDLLDPETARIARTVRSTLSEPLRWALWHALMELPLVTSNDVPKVAERMRELLAKEPKAASQVAAAELALETAVQARALSERPTSETISVQEDRVIVGGVVVKTNNSAS